MLRIISASSLLVLLVACGSDDDDGGMPDGSISAQCQEATTKSDLPWIQENIFNTSCANFTQCHMGAAVAADGLNLETGNAQANLVDVDSVRDSNFKLVVAGDADNSLLLMILGRDPANNNPAFTRTMPPGQPLCSEKVEAIGRWVNSL